MAHARWYLAGVFGPAFGLVLSCGGSGPSAPGGGGSVSTSSTPTTVSTGGGGNTGGTGCKVPEDCPGTDTPCQSRTCTGGACGAAFVPAGSPATTDTSGPCMRDQCDGSGAVTPAPDDTKLPDDGNPCTDDLCANGTPSNPPVSAGMPCSQGSGVKCDGQGACVECLDPTDCASGVCTAGACAAPSCDDLVANGDETDIDCGGLVCGPCEDGRACAVHAHCLSGYCAGSVCTAPACTDGVTNGDESDVDCGGSCAPCGVGMHCAADAHCVSSSCKNGACQTPATCANNVKDGTETDVDCGGLCVKCALFQSCSGDDDCQSGVCQGGTCLGSTCVDGVKDGQETGEDCGGSTSGCLACADGQTCLDASDCESKVCMGGVCQAASCGDVVQNGQETGVDCGGACPSCPSVVLAFGAGPGLGSADTKSFGAVFDPSTGWSPPVALTAPSVSDLGLTIAGSGAYLRGVGVARYTKLNDPLDQQLFSTLWTPSGSWEPATPIPGAVPTREGPSIASSGTTTYVTYQGTDFKHYFALLSGALWSPSAEPVGGAAFPSSGPTPSGIAATGSNVTLAFFLGPSNDPTAQERVSGVWQPTINLGNGQSYVMSPAIIALSGGGAELLVVYIRQSDGAVVYQTRSLGVWTAAAQVPGALAQASATFGSVERVGLAPLPGGGALLAYRDKTTSGIFTATYAGNAWTAPAALASPNILPLCAPSVAPGIGGANAELAFVANDQVAYHARLVSGAWTTPVAIGGKALARVVIAGAP